jgi:hypothetical protein
MGIKNEKEDNVEQMVKINNIIALHVTTKHFA